jgi:hypothetical protein
MKSTHSLSQKQNPQKNEEFWASWNALTDTKYSKFRFAFVFFLSSQLCNRISEKILLEQEISALSSEF